MARPSLAAAVTALLSACAHAPPAPVVIAESQSIEVSTVRSDIQLAYERRRSLALKYENAGDLLNASRQWEIVLVLAPHDTEASRRLGDVRSAISKSVADELSAARDALRRADLEKAEQSLLRVLSLDAYHAEAVESLREIDRRRAVRRAADRAARARIEEPAALKKRGTRRPPSGEAGDYDIEQSAELLRAGDAKVALSEFNRYVTANPRDRAARERIANAVRGQAQQLEHYGDGIAAADMYSEAIRLHGAAPKDWTTQLARLRSRLATEQYEKGVRLMGRDLGAAISHFESALRLSPAHTQAHLQLERARKMLRTLREIPAPR